MNLASKRVLVMGLGRFGGGVGVTRFLLSHGARVLVTDTAPPSTLERSVQQLEGLPVEYRLGEHREDDFRNADLIVVNPAVDPRENRFLQAAAHAGVPTISEIRLLVSHLPSGTRTVGITGSSGKSTTTAMLGHLLRTIVGPQRVHVGGNLGGSLLGQLDQIHADHIVVLELSSFMLEGLVVDRWSPHIALLTNLSPNHLDRHGTFDSYVAAKAQIFADQKPGDFAILHQRDADVIGLPQPPCACVQQLTHADLARIHVPLLAPGAHNRSNALMACAAAAALGIDFDQAQRALADFAGLPHRLQLVCEHQNVRYYNDSKATTPEAAMLALESFPADRVHAILGGYDKGSDLTTLAQRAGDHCRAVYAVGVTGPVIAQTAAHRHARIVSADTLDAAFAAMAGQLREGDVVLLSPGCASWDQFENFEARGAAFVAAALRYTSEGAAPVAPATPGDVQSQPQR